MTAILTPTVPPDELLAPSASVVKTATIPFCQAHCYTFPAYFSGICPQHDTHNPNPAYVVSGEGGGGASGCKRGVQQELMGQKPPAAGTAVAAPARV